jgi:alpha-D-ribose 1-methylphosphonate 5-triphosphate synthase subunit PhnG
MPSDAAVDIPARRDWMSVLAKAKASSLLDLWRGRPEQDLPWHFIRRPEVGLTLLRGRAGGDGQRFNLGEATVTRCSVEVDRRLIGHAYLLGRNLQHAEAAARLDALLQDPDHQAELLRAVIEPLRRAQAEERALASRKAAATKVDFFTLVRGED